MAGEDQGDKTEEATQQRRDDFRKRGQVAQTKELASAFTLLLAIGMIWLLGRMFFQQLYEVFVALLGDGVVVAARGGEWISSVTFAGEKTLMILGPVFAIAWILGFSSSVVQVGFMYNEEALSFKPERLNPVEGFKRIFSIRAVMEGIKAVIKVILVGSIAAWIVEAELVTVPTIVGYSVNQIFSYTGLVVMKMLGFVSVFMIFLAGLDYMFQRWDLEQKMKMSKQEVKEEHKNREGDPQIKARIRRVQREMAQRRMMEEVPKADVVITNPTHIAVALKYGKAMVAPTVVAKGADFVAEKIKEIARKNNVPVVENKPLARAMYKTLKIGQAIPRELYTAVAEVLSYVFKLKRRNRT